MFAASVISTMNVDCPRLSSSLAPTRVKMRSVMPTVAAFAGTKLPMWAISVMSATCRINVLLPAMFGPVMSQNDPAFGARTCIVRHERSRRQDLIEYGVPAVPDVEHRFLDQHRADVVPRGGQIRERREEVEQPRARRPCSGGAASAPPPDRGSARNSCSSSALLLSSAERTFSSYSFRTGVM